MSNVELTNTVSFSDVKTYDGQLIFNSAINQPIGAHMQRVGKLDRLTEAVYSDLNMHDTMPFVKQGAGNHMFMKGAMKHTWAWTEGENITQAHLDQFWNYVQSHAAGVSLSLVESDAAARRFVFTASFENNSNSWAAYPLPYVLDVTTSRMEVTEEGTDIICYVFADNDPNNWTKEHCNIAPNETFEISKGGTEYCYVIFGEEVNKDSTTLEAFKPYRITSDSITVTNNTSNSCKIFRIYK